MTTETRIYDQLIIGGYNYSVRVEWPSGKVLATACIGRWPMTSVVTGDSWLDNQLSRLVQERIEAAIPQAKTCCKCCSVLQADDVVHQQAGQLLCDDCMSHQRHFGT